MEKVEITLIEYKLLSAYIEQICGIQLGDDKDYLVRTRLNYLLNATGSKTFTQLYNRIRSDQTNTLKREVINAITTKETSFFRDNTPFEMLKYKIIPDIINSTDNSDLNKPLNIWSAACATGQEVYSISMIIKDVFRGITTPNINILGTDISDNAIKSANQGIYNDVEMERGLPKLVKDRYFSHKTNGWQINNEIKDLTTFETFNLFDSFENKGPFDIILCRNVTIYFNDNDKKDIFDRLGKRLKKGGYLIIGSTETIEHLCPQYISFKYKQSVYYQKRL